MIRCRPTGEPSLDFSFLCHCTSFVSMFAVSSCFFKNTCNGDVTVCRKEPTFRFRTCYFLGLNAMAGVKARSLGLRISIEFQIFFATPSLFGLLLSQAFSFSSVIIFLSLFFQLPSGSPLLHLCCCLLTKCWQWKCNYFYFFFPLTGIQHNERETTPPKNNEIFLRMKLKAIFKHVFLLLLGLNNEQCCFFIYLFIFIYFFLFLKKGQPVLISLKSFQ